MYKIIFTQRALKDFKNLDKETQNSIAKKLKEFSSNPQRYSKKLSNNKLGSYRIRIGNYRVIFDIEKNEIVILRIGHRKDIYR